MALGVCAAAFFGTTTFRFGVCFFVWKALTGDLEFTFFARSNRMWLLRKPVFLGLLCFFGSGILLLYTYYYNTLYVRILQVLSVHAIAIVFLSKFGYNQGALGTRQVVRHVVLVHAFGGSNPSSPAKLDAEYKDRVLWPVFVCVFYLCYLLRKNHPDRLAPGDCTTSLLTTFRDRQLSPSSAI